MKTVFVLMLFLLFVSCSFPHDSNDSFAKAKQEGLRVGIVNNPPYTKYENGAASGSEVKLIEDFAGKEGLKVYYEYGTETNLVKQLENYELHLCIGGFTKNTEWHKKAGLTTKYNGHNVLLIVKGENELLYRLESVLLKQKHHGS